MEKLSEPTSTALARLIAQQPFFATFLLSTMRLVETDTLPTAGTDGRTIWINPEFFAAKPAAEREFVLAHEVLHAIFDHMGRGKLYAQTGFGPDLKPWSHRKYNIVADFVINDVLKQSGVGSCPADALVNGKYDATWVVDDAYVDYDMEDEPPGDGEGPGQGHGGFDVHMEPGPGSQMSDAELQQAVAAAQQAAEAQGKMPAALKRLIGELLEPSVPWDKELRTHFQSKAGRQNTTWARPHRRRLGALGLYAPSKHGWKVGGTVVVVDTSGSVCDEMVRRMLSEVKGIMETCKPKWLKVLWTHTSVYKVDDIEQPWELDSLTADESGGTDMVAAFRYVEKHGITPETMVVLTDMYTPFPAEAPKYDVIWASVTEGRAGPFGKTIYVQP